MAALSDFVPQGFKQVVSKFIVERQACLRGDERKRDQASPVIIGLI